MAERIETEYRHFKDGRVSCIDLNYFYGDWLAETHQIRWDGCVNIWKYSNGQNDPENTDYMHICSIDEFIEKLQRLKAKGVAADFEID